ncbi:phage minor capsid protein [Dielma fastidiosa]|uniref:phage minor capsid protein n=1 Tax=Dielma fastidiosa TaxID=1034346 RepID=UPI000E46B1FE|nr:phage minor capsid protein [Dielma fastidiosa]RHN01484.1 minor capsid protein [Dielma fastidiosa]
MLDPVKLQKVPDELVRLFYDLETDILKDIAERLVMNDFKLSPTSAYRLKKLDELGLHQDAVVRKIAAILKESEKKVKKAINDTSYLNINSDNEMLKQHDLFSNANYDTGELRDIMLKGIRQTNGELRNITKSMAGAASKTYERALDNAYLKVRSGAYSYTEAIKSVVDDLASKGMETFTYKSGKHEQVSTVVRRAVLTGVNKTAIETQLANLSKMGMNLVRTTQHLGSRPTHEVWQGKTFYVGEPVEGYLSLEEGTGYGTGEGLGGWNCRHGIRIALEEMGIEYTEQPIDTEENNRIYELEQQQRYNERMIREWKRRRDIKKAGGQDHSKESRKVKEWNARQDSFVKAHPELKRQMNREIISKQVSKGLSSGKNNSLEQGGTEIIQRGKLTKTDSDTKIKVLEAYEERLVTYDHERAVVITKDGIVYEVIGHNSIVDISVIDDLKGAFVTHNHPDKVTNYSFSGEDVELFIKQEIGILRGIDNKFVYSMQRTEKTFSPFDDIKNRFKHSYFNKVIENNDWQALDDEEYHEIVKLLSNDINFIYERSGRK